MRITIKLLGITQALLMIAVLAILITDQVVGRLQAELVAHCDGPSRTDDVTIVCVDRVTP